MKIILELKKHIISLNFYHYSHLPHSFSTFMFPIFLLSLFRYILGMLRPAPPAKASVKRLKTESVSTAAFSASDGSSAAITAENQPRMQFQNLLAKAKRNLSLSGSNCRVKLEELLVEETWSEALQAELQKPYARTLCKFVESEISGSSSGSSAGLAIYPPTHLIFNALNSTPFDQVKAVILGQDPYHGPGQAMGLSFSVPVGVKLPSSLVNIFKELHQDVGCSIPSHGNLESWAVQGVLLLNAVLTVRNHQANSHAKKGWEQFTDAVIKTISEKKRGVVFLLWGNSAQQKTKVEKVFPLFPIEPKTPYSLVLDYNGIKQNDSLN
ncbi:hypothetical protein OROGR_020572 [Orobanche gracilis]